MDMKSWIGVLGVLGTWCSQGLSALSALAFLTFPALSRSGLYRGGAESAPSQSDIKLIGDSIFML